MKNQLIYFCIILFLFSCNNETPVPPKSEGVAPKDTASEKIKVPDTPENKFTSKIYLEGLYATSTALPHKDYKISNLFSESQSAVWKTMPGAGPDEGVMLYFQEPIFIQSLQLEIAEDENIEAINRTDIYIDGKYVLSVSGGEPEMIEAEASSVFLRFTNTSGTDIVDSEEKNFDVNIEKFNKKKSIGLKGVIITNKNNEVYKLLAPVELKGTVTASSLLAPAEAYHPLQLFDARKEFAWVEGSDGKGEGESLIFELEKPVELTGLKIKNGYQRSTEHFYQNGRVDQYEFGVPEQLLSHHLQDNVLEYQEFGFMENITSDKFIFKIKSVFEGKQYSDLGISEMRLMYKDTPMIIVNDEREESKKRLYQKIKETCLENIIDKRIANEVLENDLFSSRSLILRSDYTFVLYEENSSRTQKKSAEQKILADGSWELLKLEKEQAEIKVFGKYFDQSQAHIFYKGKSSSEHLKIFKDILKINYKKIKGGKFVAEYYLK